MSLFKIKLLKVPTNKTSELYDRDYLFDNIRALLILLVVIAHVIDLTNFSSPLNKTIYTFIYFFHMPTFIFISGFFSKNVDKCRETAITRYLIPYFVLVVLCFIHIKLLSSVDEETITLFRLFTPSTGCWYLFTTFIWKSFIKDLSKIRFSIPIFFIFGLATGFSHEFSLKMSLGRLAVFTVFFLLGYKTKAKHIEGIRRAPKMFSYLMLLLLVYISYYITINQLISPSTLHGKSFYSSELTTNDLIARLLFYVVSISMIFVLINIFSNKMKWFSYIGKNSITTYIIHLFIVRRIDMIFPKVEFLRNNSIIYILTVIILSLVITIVFSNSIFIHIYDSIINAINNLIFTKSKT